MRLLSTTLLFSHLCVMSCSELNSKPKWHFSGFTEVRGYLLNPDDEHSFDGLNLPSGELNPTRIPRNGVVLSPKQIDTLLFALQGGEPPEAVAACFYPHHAFEFLDADGKRVAVVNVCFMCIQHRGQPSGFGPIDYDKLGDLVDELGLEYPPKIKPRAE